MHMDAMTKRIFEGGGQDLYRAYVVRDKHNLFHTTIFLQEACSYVENVCIIC